MRALLRFLVLIGVWVSVAAAMAGFVKPWAHLDLKYRQVTESVEQVVGGVERVTEGTPLEDVTRRLTEGLSRVVVQVRQGAETVTGQLPALSEIPTEVSGEQIPQFVIRPDAKVVLALAEMLTGQRELGAKSYAVYFVPGLALLFGLMLTSARRQRLLCGLIALLCLAVAGGGFWKLLTTNVDTLLVRIVIGVGLWMSLWAYAGLGLCALLLAWLASPRRAAH